MLRRLRVIPTRLVTQAWMLAVVLMAVVVFLLLRPAAGATSLPTVRSLRMPVPHEALDRTLTIGPRSGVRIGDGTRLAVERYGFFRGHWWWNKGWVYISGEAIPGSRIHVHLDARSLTVTEIPARDGVGWVRRAGAKVIIGDYIQLDAVRFGIAADLFATRTAGGPFPGRHVADQLEGRAFSSRGLTITRDQVTSSPADHVPCILTQPTAGWDLGCRLFGQRPLVSDRRGRFASSRDSIVEAHGISVTSTPDNRTQLPTVSMRVQW